MAVTRSDIATHMRERYSYLLTDFEMATDDVPGGLKGPIDDTLRFLGVAKADRATGTLDDADEDKAYALALYFLTKTIKDNWSHRNITKSTSMGDPNTSKNESGRDRATNLKEAMDEAKALLASAGVILTGASWFAGSITLDYLEPEAC